MNKLLLVGLPLFLTGLATAIPVLRTAFNNPGYIRGSLSDSEQIVQITVYGARGKSVSQGTIEVLVYDKTGMTKLLEKAVKVSSNRVNSSTWALYDRSHSKVLFAYIKDISKEKNKFNIHLMPAFKSMLSGKKIGVIRSDYTLGFPLEK